MEVSAAIRVECQVTESLSVAGLEVSPEVLGWQAADREESPEDVDWRVANPVVFVATADSKGVIQAGYLEAAAVVAGPAVLEQTRNCVGSIEELPP